MRKILFIPLLLAVVILSACGTGALQTPPGPAPAIQTESQPTRAPSATDTSLPPATDTVAPPTDLPTQAPPAGISFANDVMPIFNASCVKCHGVEQVKEGLDMTSYAVLMAGSFNGPVITPGDAENSFLVQQVVEGEMPKRGPKLTAEQIQTISDWVNQGALNN